MSSGILDISGDTSGSVEVDDEQQEAIQEELSHEVNESHSHQNQFGACIALFCDAGFLFYEGSGTEDSMSDTLD